MVVLFTINQTGPRSPPSRPAGRCIAPPGASAKPFAEAAKLLRVFLPMRRLSPRSWLNPSRISRFNSSLSEKSTNSTPSFPKPRLLLVSTMQQVEVKKLGTQDKSEPREVTMEVAADLRMYAGLRWPMMNHKWRKARLASLLGMKERRVKSIYEADQSARLRADEEAAIKALIGKKEEADAADIALAKRISELETQVAFLVAALARDELAAHSAIAHRASASTSAKGNSAPKRRAADH